MRPLFFIFVLLIISFSSLATTKQVVDLLISGNDTIRLRESPLQKLMLKYRPFGYTKETAPSSTCLRGYRAIWRVENDKLYLEKIIRCDSEEQENIIELFQKNGLAFQSKDQMILADWYTQDLYRIKYPVTYIYLSCCTGDQKEEDVILRIEKGSITKKQLTT